MVESQVNQQKNPYHMKIVVSHQAISPERLPALSEFGRYSEELKVKKYDPSKTPDNIGR
jgi:hypothetical protein